jgi:hypothetical protein
MTCVNVDGVHHRVPSRLAVDFLHTVYSGDVTIALRGAPVLLTSAEGEWRMLAAAVCARHPVTTPCVTVVHQASNGWRPVTAARERRRANIVRWAQHV